MSVKRVRIEIVETSAEQPWHVRIVQNGKTFFTENFTRKVAAERAIVALAKTFGWTDPVFTQESPGQLVLVDSAVTDMQTSDSAFDGAIRVVRINEKV